MGEGESGYSDWVVAWQPSALCFLNFGGDTRVIVARAEVRPSGVSRTVRMILQRDAMLEFLGFGPQAPRLDRWSYE